MLAGKNILDSYRGSGHLSLPNNQFFRHLQPPPEGKVPTSAQEVPLFQKRRKENAVDKKVPPVLRPQKERAFLKKREEVKITQRTSQIWLNKLILKKLLFKKNSISIEQARTQFT
jgi:hypothetical protein